MRVIYEAEILTKLRRTITSAKCSNREIMRIYVTAEEKALLNDAIKNAPMVNELGEFNDKDPDFIMSFMGIDIYQASPYLTGMDEV